jgi:hypothetical protein
MTEVSMLKRFSQFLVPLLALSASRGLVRLGVEDFDLGTLDDEHAISPLIKSGGCGPALGALPLQEVPYFE